MFQIDHILIIFRNSLVSFVTIKLSFSFYVTNFTENSKFWRNSTENTKSWPKNTTELFKLSVKWTVRNFNGDKLSTPSISKSSTISIDDINQQSSIQQKLGKVVYDNSKIIGRFKFITGSFIKCKKSKMNENVTVEQILYEFHVNLLKNIKLLLCYVIVLLEKYFTTQAKHLTAGWLTNVNGFICWVGWWKCLWHATKWQGNWNFCSKSASPVSVQDELGHRE